MFRIIFKDGTLSFKIIILFRVFDINRKVHFGSYVIRNHFDESFFGFANTHVKNVS